MPEAANRHPLAGGCGLKLGDTGTLAVRILSPARGRVWIETPANYLQIAINVVSPARGRVWIETSPGARDCCRSDVTRSRAGVD